MSAKNRKLVIVELWEQTGRESAGTEELEFIQQALGADANESPASIARILADEGVVLRHPEVLEADIRWREREQLFTFEDLNFGTLAGALALMEKIETLRLMFEGNNSTLERLRQRVLGIKTELELLGANELAQEVTQWLAIWLQNPQIFPGWLALRRETAEFRRDFRM